MAAEKKSATSDTINESPLANNVCCQSEAILEQLQKNEKISRDILKAVVFIKYHYFWRSVFYGLKIAILVLVIVLGVVSWRSIVDYATDFAALYMPATKVNSINLINSQ